MIYDFFQQPRLTEKQTNTFDRVVRKEQFLSSRLYTSFTLLLSLFFLISDYQFLREEFELVAIIRVSVVFSCLLVFWLLSYISTKAAFIVIALGVMTYNAAIVYIGVLAASYELYVYQQGTVLIIIYCCTLFQAPFRHTATIMVICCLSYVIGIVFFSSTEPVVVLNNIFVFITAATLGLMAVVQREGFLIQNFIHSLNLKEQNKEVHKQAMTDALTQLPNRHSIMKVLDDYQGGVPNEMLVMMIDVDDFKLINDDFGHSVGDVALQRIAMTLKKRVDEEQGYIARYGGEEFLVFLENVSRTYAHRIAESLIEEVRSIHDEGFPIITVSLGAYITKGLEQSISECIEVADQELLRAKKSGKNQAMFAGF